MQKIIAARIKAGTLRRVLWATHSIHGSESLGVEAAEAFGTLGMDVQIVVPKSTLR